LGSVAKQFNVVQTVPEVGSVRIVPEVVINCKLFAPKSNVDGVVALPILSVAEVDAAPLVESELLSRPPAWALKTKWQPPPSEFSVFISASAPTLMPK